MVNSSNIGDAEASYAKKPYEVSTVISPTYAIYLNIQSILVLELICELAGINLIYSTWSLETDAVINAANLASLDNRIPIPFKNYIEIDYRTVNNNCEDAAERLPKDCHLNLAEHPQFYIGRQNNHMGVHAHAHVAENFIAELGRRGYIL
tara:strand:- start:7889 stop:8338 length:450 start_codon:yes stop_codon:yes gene_type:complete